jgi:hypothetical protein
VEADAEAAAPKRVIATVEKRIVDDYEWCKVECGEVRSAKAKDWKVEGESGKLERMS